MNRALLASALAVSAAAGFATAQQWVGPTGPQARLDYVTGNVYVGTTGFSNPVTRFDVVDRADTGRVIAIHGFAGTPSNGVRTTAIWGETNNPAGRALQGFNFASTGIGSGVWAETATATGFGIRARATNAAGANFGGYFDNASVSGVGVYGTVSNATAAATPIAVWGNSANDTGYAAYFTGGRNYFQGRVGIGTANPQRPLVIDASDDVTLLEARNNSTAPNACGFQGEIVNTSPGAFSAAVRGQNSSTTTAGIGVWGSHAGAGYGVYGVALQPGGYAGYFNGAVSINGTLSKTGGTFKIDHPLDPANKYLYHSFVESPDMMNIYNGNAVTDADGYAVVTMPAYFSALNTDFRYQLTVIDEADDNDIFIWAKVVRKINDNTFTIRTSRGNVEVSWQVTGVRQDAWANANRVQVEVEKDVRNKGKYLHPQLFGAPESARVNYLHAEAPAKSAAPNLPPRQAPNLQEAPLTPAVTTAQLSGN